MDRPAARSTVVLVTGVDTAATEAVTCALGRDLPGAVTVRHRIDAGTQQLLRVVADATGELEREQVTTGHVCIDCALGTDVVPTLDRVTRAGHWRTVVLCLPAGTEASRFTATLGRAAGLARRLRVSSVVAALAGTTVVADLLGGTAGPLRPDAGEEGATAALACSMVEHADVVTVGSGTDPTGVDLVRALARPDAVVARGAQQLPAGLLTTGRHDPRRTAWWADPERFAEEVPELGPPASARVWRLDLSSPRPFHPRRLGARLPQLAAGRYRVRGCLWLPTRPGRAQVWAGAAGRSSLTGGDPWGRRTPRTRLVLTGVGAEPDQLRAAFHQLLAGPFELALRNWRVGEDGLEPWLGGIQTAA